MTSHFKLGKYQKKKEDLSSIEICHIYILINRAVRCAMVYTI